jgi:hypothetical protein
LQDEQNDLRELKVGRWREKANNTEEWMYQQNERLNIFYSLVFVSADSATYCHSALLHKDLPFVSGTLQ